MADAENKQDKQEETEEAPKKQEPAQPMAAPAADPLATILNFITQQSAAMAALEQRVNALQSQQAVDSSIAHEANGGHGIPTNTDASGQDEDEGGEDYPEIDLEEISRMIGDY